MFVGTLVVRGFTPRAAVLAMSAIYGNVVMIGIPLVALLWGPAGSALLFTLISVHALVLLTSGDRRDRAGGGAHARMDAPRGALGCESCCEAVLHALWHPVPLPIVAGLLFGQTGLPIPAVLDADFETAWPGIRSGRAAAGRGHAGAHAGRLATGRRARAGAR